MKENLEAKVALEQLNITTLFGKKVLEQIQKTISEATGLAFVTIDYRGEPVTELTGFTPFCRQIRKCSAKVQTCRSSDAFGSISAAVSQKPFVYLCPCGLLEVAIPLIVRNHYLGGFIGGQIKVDNLPDNIVRLENIFNQATNSQISIEDWKLIKKTPRMSYEKFMTIVDLISVVIGYLGEKEVLRIHDEKVLSNTQYIERWQNKYEISSEHLNNLVDSIDNNDFASIYYSIPKVIGELYQHSQNNTEIIFNIIKEVQTQFIHSIKGIDMDNYFREIESFNSFSPEVKEIMKDLVKSIYLDEKSVNSIFSLDKVDFNHKISVEYWLFRAIDYLLQQRVMTKSKKFEQVFNYIDQHINENIGLTEITRECNVSQGYLSRIFRQHLHISVMNYLHMKKLYLAKRYLCLNDFSVTEVTYKLDYNEVNYFMKVFKKYEKITANQYKHLYYKDDSWVKDVTT